MLHLWFMLQVVAAGMFYGDDAYFNSGWNIMDGSLVSISIIDLLMSLVSDSSPRIFGILRVISMLIRTVRRQSYIFFVSSLGVPSITITSSAASNQSSPWTEIGRSDTTVIVTANRKYCPHLLHIFHNFRYTWRPIVQRDIFLLRRGGDKARKE